MKIRINKYLSNAGYCSRRDADKLILAKKVTVNGKIAQIGQIINNSDVVTIKGKEIEEKKEYTYIIFNKPKGVITTSNKKVKNNIIDYINFKEHIFYIGRLDKDSEGLVLLSNDGSIVNKILKSSNKHEKEYIVEVDKKITTHFLENMSKGVPILNTKTKPCKIEKISTNKFKIILTQGLNRQIRRMCGYFDYKVLKLKRVRIMNLKLDIPTGEYRYLKKDEVNKLKEILNKENDK